MPELPEVEVARRGLDEPLRGARVLALRLGKPLRWPLGCDPTSLVGTTVGPIERRAKYLWMPLRSTASDTQGLLLHLGMSGSLSLVHAGLVAGPYDHFELETDRGVLRLTDPRRFGAVVWSPSRQAPPAATLLASLGAEPFDETFTPAQFHAALHKRRSPIKSVLLSGDVVVGAGNIYACEALFQAGIHPALRSDRISRPRAARLLAALRSTLQRALDLGGSTLRDFRDAHGMAGVFQTQAGVYGRAGQPCLRCGATVRRIVQAQRSTYFCPNCQKR